MTNTGTIYLILNRLNGHKYVGQTRVPLNKRWAQHLQEAKTYSTRPLYAAINKYGSDKFTIKVLEECNVDVLNEREVYWIEKLNTFKGADGYNATCGGDFFNHTNETKQKISEGMKKVERSDEWVNNIATSLQEKAKKEPWGFLNAENRCNGEHTKRSVKGTCLTTGKEVVFESMTEAARIVNGKNGNISAAIKNNWTAYGYKWEKVNKTPVKIQCYGVHKYTGERTITFPSIKSAMHYLGGKHDSGIRKALKSDGKSSWYGYYWFFFNPDSESEELYQDQ